MPAAQDNRTHKGVNKILSMIGVILLFFVFALWNTYTVDTVAPPTIITYQGKVLENGSSVTTTQSMAFLIYDATAGGSLLYTASGTLVATTTISVTPSSGIFSVNLGDGSTTNAVSSSIFANNASLYLEVWIGGSKLSPRKRLTSAAYAINSEYLLGISAAASGTSQYIPYSDSNGNFAFSGNPQSTGVSGGTIYINPAAADANETLFGIALNGAERFRVDEDGDVSINGGLTVDSNTFVVSTTAKRVGVNNANPTATLDVTGDFTVSATATVNDVLDVNGKTITQTGVYNSSTILDGAESIFVAGEYAYVVADGTSDSLSVFDVSDKTSPTLISTVNDASPNHYLNGPADIFVSGNYAYITLGGTTSSLVVYDISNPTAPNMVGSIDDSGSVNLDNPFSVFVTGNYAYVSSFADNGISIIDVSDPTNPTHVSSLTDIGTMQGAQGMFVAGKYAYVASRSADEVTIVDVSDPVNPSIAGSIADGDGGATLADAHEVFVSGNHAYITTSFGGSTVTIIDISDPSDPTFSGEVSVDSAESVFVAGEYAYATRYEGIGEIDVIDISDKTSPSVVATAAGDVSNLGSPRDIFVSGNYLYVASEGDDQFEIYDISGATISNAQIGSAEVGSIQVNDYARFLNGVHIRNGLSTGESLLVGGGMIGLYSNTNTPNNTNTIAFSHTAVLETNVPATDANAFIFNTKNTLGSGDLLSIRNNNTVRFVVDESGNVGVNTSTPTYRLTVDGTGYIYDNFRVGSVFDVNTGTSRVGINSTTPQRSLSVNGDAYITGTTTIDGNITSNVSMIGDIFDPTEVSTYDPYSGFMEQFVVIDDYLYVAESAEGLGIIDISIPENPVSIGTVDPGGTIEGLDVVGNYAYVVGSNGLDIISIHDPQSPQVVGNINNPSTEVKVKVAGNYAYVAQGSSLYINDISDPTDPVLVGSLSPGGGTVHDVDVAQGYAYVAAGTSGLRIVDVRDPQNPILINTFDPGEARAVTVKGKYAYVSGNTDGFHIIDISNPAAPSTDSTYTPTDGNSIAAHIGEKYAYLALFSGTINDNGVGIIDISSSTNPVEILDSFKLSPLEQVSDVYVNDGYMYVAGTGNGMIIVDLERTDIANAQIGHANVGNLAVGGTTQFSKNVHVRGGLTVGNSGLLLNGDLSISSPTTTAGATNTFRLSHTGYFITHVTSTDANAYIFDTKNTINNGANSYLFSVRNAGTPVFSIATNGDVHTTGTYYGAAAAVSTPGSPGDLAERVDILPGETVSPGDVMIVDVLGTDRYRKSTGAFSSKVAGVISTRPTITLGDGRTEHTAVMALVGRVPINVTTQNGAIERGDLLVTASTTGHAMKYDPNVDEYDHAVSVIGVALESYDGADPGKILGLVRSGWINNRYETIAALQQSLAELAADAGENLQDDPAELGVELNGDGELVNIEADLNLNGNYIVNVAGITGENSDWKIDTDGRFVTNVETRDGERSLYALQSQGTEYVFSGSDTLHAGQRFVDFDDITKDIIDPEQEMKVTVTLTNNANGIYVSEKTPDGFMVKELLNGRSNATFDWVVIASRRLGPLPVLEEEEAEEAQEEPAEADPVEEDPVAEDDPALADDGGGDQPVEEENAEPIEEDEAPPAEEPVVEEDPEPAPEEQPAEEVVEEEEPPAPPAVDEIVEEPQAEPEVEAPAEEVDAPVEEEPVVEEAAEPAPEEVPALPEEAI